MAVGLLPACSEVWEGGVSAETSDFGKLDLRQPKLINMMATGTYRARVGRFRCGCTGCRRPAVCIVGWEAIICG